ncbi:MULTISPECIES: hypothetical protein [unclassified Rathayibacter]|jgi:hypothetical protein|uniref:hypothetical protein n=1 Tax=unclassified Rathayibacter TaxID=2609250 RepID=UPI000CE871FE|nr:MULTISPECIES: hypothetical protein [unclassified Rathayibacter]PPF11438.1 hypothetical protein C5B98_08555 [Rathayibacter sp. AY1A5]PPF48570.1 hypothetical protein C5E14_06685 [Rathayibacter sp. AY1A1]PPF71967.1 hypothetical protein C5C46_08520 [Rathayibacter sp. AY1E6]PPG81832.1 hypothetical protein C5C29_15100 [Rathayibacter sp. AY1H2]PPG99643.1 hypothetical protein C5C32_10880 [Rathayibacter sp. AY1G9]
MWLEGIALERRLRELDTPGPGDEPVDFDGQRLAAKVDALVALLDESFPRAVTADRPWEWQDSATFTHVTVDGAANRTSANLVICISRHGDLCFIALEAQEAYTREEFDALVEPEDLSSILAALDTVNFTVTAEETLWARYDGPRVMSNSSWIERYFGYPI